MGRGSNNAGGMVAACTCAARIYTQRNRVKVETRDILIKIKTDVEKYWCARFCIGAQLRSLYISKILVCTYELKLTHSLWRLR